MFEPIVKQTVFYAIRNAGGVRQLAWKMTLYKLVARLHKSKPNSSARIECPVQLQREKLQYVVFSASSLECEPMPSMEPCWWVRVAAYYINVT